MLIGSGAVFWGWGVVTMKGGPWLFRVQCAPQPSDPTLGRAPSTMRTCSRNVEKNGAHVQPVHRCDRQYHWLLFPFVGQTAPPGITPRLLFQMTKRGTLLAHSQYDEVDEHLWNFFFSFFFLGRCCQQALREPTGQVS